MKRSVFFSALLGLTLVLGVSGCKHRADRTTVIPGLKPQAVGEADKPKIEVDQPQVVARPTQPEIVPSLPQPSDPVNVEPTAFQDGSPWDVLRQNGDEDRQVLAAETIYFETDSAAVKDSERKKLQNVLEYFKANKHVLTIEGHCDERGTEGYNQSLGDRRALAVREYLINLGLENGRMGTVSFGESKPADAGHTEAAWSKNRRAVFVVIKPKAQAQK